MFDLAEKQLVWIPIRWKGLKAAAADELAESCEHEIECQVELVSNERLREIFGQAEVEDGTQGAQPNPENQLSDVEKFKALCHDWRGVKMAKQSAPMTDENVELMLKVPMFPTGFEISYLKAWGGQVELREKNSDSSPGDGPAGEEKGGRKSQKKAAPAKA